MLESHTSKSDDRNQLFSFSKSSVFHGRVAIHNIFGCKTLKCIGWALVLPVSSKFIGGFLNGDKAFKCCHINI